jgi:hypothetical protein
MMLHTVKRNLLMAQQWSSADSSCSPSPPIKKVSMDRIRFDLHPWALRRRSDLGSAYGGGHDWAGPGDQQNVVSFLWIISHRMLFGRWYGSGCRSLDPHK